MNEPTAVAGQQSLLIDTRTDARTHAREEGTQPTGMRDLGRNTLSHLRDAQLFFEQLAVRH